jgi:hypothetical protein
MAGRGPSGITFGKVAVYGEDLDKCKDVLKYVLENIGYPNENMQPPNLDEEEEELGLDDETPEIERDGEIAAPEEDLDVGADSSKKPALPWQRGREDA